MPPHSKLLVEEGAAIVSFKIVRGGAFQEADITRLLLAPGDLAASVPGISGTRNLADNLSDLRAQVWGDACVLRRARKHVAAQHARPA